MEQFLSQLTQLVAVVVGTLLTALVAEAIKFAKKKQTEIMQKINISRHEYIISVAGSAYFSVEQTMRNSSSEDKKRQFDLIMIGLIPDITPEELENSRESIVGSMKPPTVVYTPPTEQGD